MRDEDPLDRPVEERREGGPDRRRRRALVEPRIRADAHPVGGADEHVAGDERGVLRQPPQRFVDLGHAERLDAGGRLVRGGVALDELRRAPLMPRNREQDGDRQPAAFHVAVKRLEEAFPLGRHERIDQDGRSRAPRSRRSRPPAPSRRPPSSPGAAPSSARARAQGCPPSPSDHVRSRHVGARTPHVRYGRWSGDDAGRSIQPTMSEAAMSGPGPHMSATAGD